MVGRSRREKFPKKHNCYDIYHNSSTPPPFPSIKALNLLNLPPTPLLRLKMNPAHPARHLRAIIRLRIKNYYVGAITDGVCHDLPLIMALLK